MYVKTSEPVFVYQMIMGDAPSAVKTQGMNSIPSISCQTSSFGDNIPDIDKILTEDYGTGAIFIVTRKGSTVSVTATVEVLTRFVAASIDSDRISQSSGVTVSVVSPSGLMNYEWSTDSVGTIGDGLSNTSFRSIPLDDAVYTVTANFIADPSCYASDEVTVVVTKVLLPDQVFSPGNGDGVNDYCRIISLNTDDYPQNVVQVFNR